MRPAGGHGPRSRLLPSPLGRGQAGPEDLPVLPLLPLASPLATSRGEGRGQNLTLWSLGPMYLAKPLL